MDLLAHYTLRRCTNCGVIGNGYPIHTADCHRPATERIDVVPAARLEGAVEALDEAARLLRLASGAGDWWPQRNAWLERHSTTRGQ